MTTGMMSYDEMIAVLRAAKLGKIIQCSAKETNPLWTDMKNPVWNFALCNYRAKPEPKIIYVREFPDGSRTIFMDSKDVSSFRDPHDALTTPPSKLKKFVEVLD